MRRDINEAFEIFKEHGLDLAKILRETHCETMMQLGSILKERFEVTLKMHSLNVGEKINEKHYQKKGKLYNLGSKIEKAKEVGLLDKDTYEDADLLRLIRNEFAHLQNKLHFDSPRIVAFVSKLTTYKAAETNQSAILEAVGKVCDRLTAAEKAERPKKPRSGAPGAV